MMTTKKTAGAAKPKPRRALGPFTGELSKPIQMPRLPDPRPVTQLSSEVETIKNNAARVDLMRDWAEIAARQAVEKMPLLLDHYGIDRKGSGCWYQLATMLAIEFVPGFQTTTSGRAEAWSDVDLVALYYDVTELMQKNISLSATAACRIASRSTRWKGKAAGTLANRFGQAKNNPFVTFANWLADRLGPEKGREALKLFSEKRG
jgi:hypothetical protein